MMTKVSKAVTILRWNPKIVDIYHLVMKVNFSGSAIQGVMKYIKAKGIEVTGYKSLLEGATANVYARDRSAVIDININVFLI